MLAIAAQCLLRTVQSLSHKYATSTLQPCIVVILYSEPAHVCLKMTFSCGGSQLHLIDGYLGGWAHTSLSQRPKRHLDWFSHFCTTRLVRPQLKAIYHATLYQNSISCRHVYVSPSVRLSVTRRYCVVSKWLNDRNTALCTIVHRTVTI